MTNPNISTSHENVVQFPEQIYADIALIDPERNPAFIAFEEIKGSSLATLFLEGYALEAKRELEKQTRDDSTDYSLDLAMSNISYIARYYLDGSDQDLLTKLRESLAPWQKAYETLKARQQNNQE